MNSWRGRREFQRECHKKHKYCTSLLAHLFRILQILEAKCKIINLRKGSSTRLWFQICCGKKPNLLLVSWSKLTWAYFSDGLVFTHQLQSSSRHHPTADPTGGDWESNSPRSEALWKARWNNTFDITKPTPERTNGWNSNVNEGLVKIPIFYLIKVMWFSGSVSFQGG